MFLCDNGRHASRDGSHDVNGGVVVLLGEFSGEDDMTVQNGSCFIGDRFRHVIAFHKNRVERRNGAFRRIARAFHELGELGEDGRREAAACRRFTSREADFTLRTTETRHGIHEQQDLFAFVAEIFRDGRRHVGGFETLHAGAIRCRTDDDGFAHAFLAQIAFDEFADFAATFTDERQNGHFRLRVADDLRHQRTFTAAGRSENTETLPFAACQHAVDGADAQRQRILDDSAFQRVGRIGEHGIVGFRIEDAFRIRVNRTSKTVDHMAEQIRADADTVNTMSRNDFRQRRNALHPSEGRQQHFAFGETDDLRENLQILP